MKSQAQTPIRALIVDDENKACSNLKNMLLSYVDATLDVIGFAHNTTEAEAAIKLHKPDAIFLDIHMPHGDVFRMLDNMRPLEFEVIFVTAFDEYAVKAFRLNALDYILKPISVNELKNAVNKLKEKINYKRIVASENMTYADLGEQINKKDLHKNITFKDANNVEIVNFRDVLFIEADSSYCRIVFIKDRQNKEMIMSNPLSDYEEVLPAELFFRVHKSYLVNCGHIKRIDNSENHCIILDNDTTLPISRRRYGALLDFLRANEHNYG